VPWKGLDVLIETMKDLRDWNLLIAGDGPQREALKKQITKNKLQNRVFMLGQVSREEILNNLQKAEVFVLNSSFESFSFQTVEAMSIGTPVIATNIGSLPELISHGKSGFLIDPDDKEAIIKYVEAIGASKKRWDSLSTEGFRSSQKFHTKKAVPELVSAINSIL